MKTMVLAAAILAAAGSAAYTEADGGGGGTATSQEWLAENGNASVPATEWFAANAAQRQVLSHTYEGVTYPINGQTNRG